MGKLTDLQGVQFDVSGMQGPAGHEQKGGKYSSNWMGNKWIRICVRHYKCKTYKSKNKEVKKIRGYAQNYGLYWTCQRSGNVRSKVENIR